MSIHIGFILLCFLWGVQRLFFWVRTTDPNARCTEDLLNGVSAVLYSAIYGLLVLFLANLLTPTECAATPLFTGRTSTHQSWVSPPAYGSTIFIPGSIPEPEVPGSYPDSQYFNMGMGMKDPFAVGGSGYPQVVLLTVLRGWLVVVLAV